MQKKTIVGYSVLFIVMCVSGYLIYRGERVPSDHYGPLPDAAISDEPAHESQDVVGVLYNT